MNIETYLTFFLASNVVCLMPGPTMLLVMHYSILYGKQSARHSLLGVALGDITAIAISFTVIGAVLNAFPSFFEVLKLLAGCYIILLGLREMKYAFYKKGEEIKIERRPKATSIFRHLFIITAFNPKTIIFFMAFFPQFINAAEYEARQLVLMGASFVLIGAFYTLIVQILARQISDYIKQPIFKQRMHLVVGIVLCIIGALTMLD